MNKRIRDRVFGLCGPTLLTGAGMLGCQGQADRASASPDEVPVEGSVSENVQESDSIALQSLSPIGETVLSAMDVQADPCQDFYRYACGNWLDQTELPADKPSYGRGFTEVRDRNSKSLGKILAAAGQAETSSIDPGLTKVGRFYAACMDESAIEELALIPLQSELRKIAQLNNLRSLLRFVGQEHGTSLAGAFFGSSQDQDFKQPDLYILGINQGGLGLPDRSFYLEDEKKPILSFYLQYVEKMLRFAGVPADQAGIRAQAVVAFETELAKASKPKAELRDPEKIYHPKTQKELVAMSPSWPWKVYFKAIGMPKDGRINVSVPEFTEQLPEIVRATPVEVWRDYLRARLVGRAAPHLSSALVDARFELQQKLQGSKVNKPRWERCVRATTFAYPDLVAKAYVDHHFAGDSRKIALEMIQDIEAAFEASLPQLGWMDDLTRQRAREKMAAISNKIGFPVQWRSYEGINANRGHYENVVEAQSYDWKQRIGKIGKRVNPDEWEIPASMVNAFYNPLQNEMVFPAGIMQPPFFSQDFPRAMNYGAIGMAMGHELSHGFDDSGRKFDGQGVMREWWEKAVSQRFEQQAECIDQAYSKVEIQPGVHLNGQLTLGENIADFGGMKLSAAAYQSWVAENGAEAPVIEGLANEQLLFVAYAQAWCTQQSPEFARLMATVDPHSPPKQRVNLMLSHLPAFWEAFSCSEDSAMRTKNRCEVW